MKIMVKVIKVYPKNYCYECGEGGTIFHPVTKDWEEVDESLVCDLKDALDVLNTKGGYKDYKYILVEYRNNDNIIDTAFASLKDFTEKVKAEEARRKEAAKKAADTKAKNALEKKRKQLEKLKRELGE